MACGACHIAFDPLNPPADPAHPAWENIKALVGNQYSRISNILGLGHARRTAWNGSSSRTRGPGIVDTSALPDGPRHQPRHDERDHQLRAAADARRTRC